MKQFKVYSQPYGREPFIDFLKGLSILGVIWLHCMPLQNQMLGPLWCKMSVSFFVLIQVFNTFRYHNVTFPNIRKLWRRIVLPMLVFTCILGFIQYEWGIVRHANGLWGMLKSGGYGPGCYYPWLYLQFAFLLPLVGYLYSHYPRRVGGAILIISIFMEIVCSYLQMPEWLWRILFFRYTLLVMLGYDIISNGIRLTPGLFILSLLSILFILIAHYGDISIEPLLIHNGWKVEHWPAYFYPAYLLLWIIRSVYDKIPESIKKMISEIGKASYEIFLCQMLFFSLLAPSRLELFSNKILNLAIYLLIGWSSCVYGGYLIYSRTNIYGKKCLK